MMRKFLERYGRSVDLDRKQYNSYFSQGVARADFLLFDGQVICEVKEIQNVKVQHQVEKLASKSRLSEQNFKRDFYNSINQALTKANKQIEQSKEALSYPDALGLVVLENLIQSDLSVLSLIDASNRKMLDGLKHVDGVLCLDMVNTFSDPDSKLVRLSQLVMRDSQRSTKLGELLQQLMSDFCDDLDIPFYKEFSIRAGEQVWQTNKDGKYQAYKAKFDLQTPITKAKSGLKEQLAKFLDKWWWVISLPAILYDWFIR